MTWYHNNIEFDESQIENNVGFIYIITELSTNRQYIGQKIFHNKVAKKPLKGMKNRRISKKQSDWLSYYGSNDELKARVLELGDSNYRREIIRLCKSKSEMNYWELKTIMETDALLNPDKFFNSWVSFRINRNQLKHISN